MSLLFFSAKYNAIDNRSFLLDAEYSQYQSFHADLSAYDMTGLVGSIYGKYRFYSFIAGLTYLISRETYTVQTDVLAYDDQIGSVFYAVLSPGWNIVSQPWSVAVETPAFRLEASSDLINWFAPEDPENDLVCPNFYRFKEDTGSPGNWYEEIALDQGRLEPNQSYWIRNEKPYPVVLRIVKMLNTGAVRVAPPSDAIRTLVAEFRLKRVMNCLVPECFASLFRTCPPDPPVLAGSEKDAIGASGGGGGGCFIISIAGEGVAHGRAILIYTVILAFIGVVTASFIRGKNETQYQKSDHT